MSSSYSTPIFTADMLEGRHLLDRRKDTPQANSLISCRDITQVLAGFSSRACGGKDIGCVTTVQEAKASSAQRGREQLTQRATCPSCSCLSVWRHCKVQHASGMSFERGYLGQAGCFPQVHLVVRIAMSAQQLIYRLRPSQAAYLAASVDTVYHGAFDRVPQSATTQPG